MRLGSPVGAAVLLLLPVAACSSSNKPACPPQPTPVFESSVTAIEPPGQAPQEPVTTEPRPRPETIDEQAACAALTSHATMHVEDTVGGAAVALWPNPGAGAAAVVQDANRFVDAYESAGAAPARERPPLGQRCALFDLVPPWGHAVIRVDERFTVRVLLESRNRPTILSLRSSARAYASTVPAWARDGRWLGSLRPEAPAVDPSSQRD